MSDFTHTTSPRLWLTTTGMPQSSDTSLMLMDYSGGLFRTGMNWVGLTWQTCLGVTLNLIATAKQTYKPLETEELFALFQLDMEPQERLLLAILITTGMRLDEAALLTWERIVTRHGVSCFGLVGDARVKNEGSMRYVPVPSVVKPLLGMVVRDGYSITG